MDDIKLPKASSLKAGMAYAFTAMTKLKEEILTSLKTPLLSLLLLELFTALLIFRYQKIIQPIS